MKSREQIPYGWQRLLDQTHGDLDTIGVEQVQVQVMGFLPDIWIKVRVWTNVGDERRAKIERIEHDFVERIERTCERCGKPGHRWKFEQARDQILCDRHAKEIGG